MTERTERAGRLQGAPGRIEWTVAILLTMAAIGLLAFYYLRITSLRHLDSVFLLESLQSVARGHLPSSQTVATWPAALATFTQPADAVCSALLSSGLGPYAIFDNHAYLALLPMGWASIALGPEMTLALANAAAHVLLLALPYFFLRRWGCGRMGAVAFSACVALYSGWSFSALGDYYLDRIYMPFALGALYFGHRLFFSGDASRRALAGFFACSIGAALCTERGAVMMIGLVAFLLVLGPRPSRPPRRVHAWVVALGALLAAYLAVYFSVFFVGIEQGGALSTHILTIDALRARVHEPKLVAFVLANAMLGALALVAGWRLFLLLLGALLPNLLISVGGAELNGWLTHYHAMYMPFLVFVAAVGYARLVALGRGAEPVVATGILATAIAWASVLEPSAGAIGKPSMAAMRDGILGRTYTFFLRSEQSSDRASAALFRKLAAVVPAGSRVSTVEAGMPALFRDRTLTYYPIGIGEADYVVASGSVSGTDLSGLGGAVSYLGAPVQSAVNQCLAERLAGSGFRVLASEPGLNLVVLARSQAGR